MGMLADTLDKMLDDILNPTGQYAPFAVTVEPE
jgi:hypothetical protein